MERVILHADLNNCYASIELLHRPALRESGKPVIVGGDVEARHGIVLAKNDAAKKYGIKTGEVVWQALQKCPHLVSVPANFELYMRFSQMAREIYSEYSNQVQAFGIDENWIDVTASAGIFGNGEKIANEIRERMKRELGVTISVGVSWNKIFAKLGSDMKKPDATTVISQNDFKNKVWSLPVSDLLYVGPATAKKLHARSIHTIGGLANANITLLKSWIGNANAEMLWHFANGLDSSPVTYEDVDETSAIKSVGNSTTCPRDLTTPEDVKIVFYTLAESVASRMRESGFEAQTVQIYVRDSELNSFERQERLERSTCLASDLVKTGMKLFNQSYVWNKPLRSVGIRGCDLVIPKQEVQLSLLENEESRLKREQLERTTDILRGRYGYFSLQRGLMLKDKNLSNIDAKKDHTIHPVAYAM